MSPLLSSKCPHCCCPPRTAAPAALRAPLPLLSSAHPRHCCPPRAPAAGVLRAPLLLVSSACPRRWCPPRAPTAGVLHAPPLLVSSVSAPQLLSSAHRRHCCPPRTTAAAVLRAAPLLLSSVRPRRCCPPRAPAAIGHWSSWSPVGGHRGHRWSVVVAAVAYSHTYSSISSTVNARRSGGGDGVLSLLVFVGAGRRWVRRADGHLQHTDSE